MESSVFGLTGNRIQTVEVEGLPRFRMSDTVENKITRLKYLRESVIKFITVTQIMHNRRKIKVFSTDFDYIKNIKSYLNISQADTSKIYVVLNELNDSDIFVHYRECYAEIVNEKNEDGILSISESIIFSEFRENTYRLYTEIADNI